MKMPKKGLGREEILGKLEEYRSKDLNPHDGRTFAYIYDPGPEAYSVAVEAYTRFLMENGLDPTVYPSLLRLENEIVEMSRDLVSGGPEVVGNVTSGGTESIMMAVKTARDYSRAKKPHIKEPEMILPVTAHAAFQKAAHYLCVKPVRVEVNRVTYKADIEMIREAINPNTILLVSSAPSYAHGVIDPVKEIAALAIERGLLCHVDACVGGFILPFFRKLGENITPYDFSVPGVTSISLDLHKYGFAPKNASLILYRDSELRSYQIFACSGWTGYTVVNPAFQSSRTGGPLAGAWTMLHFLGEDGYMELARRMLDATRRLVAGIGQIPGLYVMGKPEANLVAVTSDTVNVFHIADEMRARKWYIQPQLGLRDYRENFHFSMAAQNAKWVEPVLKDLAEATEAAKAMPPSGLAATVKEVFAGMRPEDLTPELFGKLLGMGGVEGTAMPSRMADINEILNSLQPEMADRLLILYWNEINRYREG
jgi:sphinganine-1-phosphate aldolase